MSNTQYGDPNISKLLQLVVNIILSIREIVCFDVLGC